ncbi:uncharacterized protein LOC144128433 isoform X2 [Amblyomma americanum]
MERATRAGVLQGEMRVEPRVPALDPPCRCAPTVQKHSRRAFSLLHMGLHDPLDQSGFTAHTSDDANYAGSSLQDSSGTRYQSCLVRLWCNRSTWTEVLHQPENS